MEVKYDQDDWQIIIEEHVRLSCCMDQSLHYLRRQFPRYARLCRKTFEDYLDSEAGQVMLDQALAAQQAEIEARLTLNRMKWSAMSLYQLWEECTRELLMRALAGDKDAERKAIQYLRLANSIFKAAQFDRHQEEQKPNMQVTMRGMQDSVAQAPQPCSTSVPACAPRSTSVPACAPAAAPTPQPSSTATLAGILACAAACTPVSPSAVARKIASA
ncbi:MAG: hypothetical protein ABSE73_22500, partial [Planctomycetota bacterium]